VELLHICSLGLLFETEDGSSTFFRNIGKLLHSIRRHIPEDTVLQNEKVYACVESYETGAKTNSLWVPHITGVKLRIPSDYDYVYSN
jgi:hypothetical protein